MFFTVGWISFYIFVIISTILALVLRKKLTQKDGLLKGSLPKGILKFVTPLLLSGLFNQFYNLVDSIVVGQLIGHYALGAVSMSGTVTWFVMSFFFGIGIGMSVVISQCYGAKDTLKLKAAVNTTVICFAVVGSLLGLVGMVLSPLILTYLLNAPPEILPYANDYLSIMFGGFGIFATYMAVSSILQATGDSTTPFIMLAISTVVNIFLTVVLVAHFGLGIRAVALATLFSQAIAMLGCIIKLLTHHNEAIRLQLNSLRFDRAVAKQSLKLGLPMGIQQAITSFGFLLQTVFIGGFGATALAANGALARIDSLLLIPTFAFMQTASTLAGQNFGAGQLDRLKRGVSFIAVFTVTLTLLLVIPTFIFRTNILQLFINEGGFAAVVIGSEALTITLIGYPFTALTFLFAGAIRGAGKTTIPLIISFVGLYLIRVPLIIIFTNHDLNLMYLGLSGIWLSQPIHWVVTATLGFLYFKFGNWQKPKLKPLTAD